MGVLHKQIYIPRPDQSSNTDYCCLIGVVVNIVPPVTNGTAGINIICFVFKVEPPSFAVLKINTILVNAASIVTNVTSLDPSLPDFP